MNLLLPQPIEMRRRQLKQYFAALNRLHPPPAMALLMPIVASIIAIYLFRGIKNSHIQKTLRLTPKVLLLRAVLAAIFVVAITAAVHRVDSSWAGLFSAFPATLLPLMLIVHATYGKQHVFTIIKNMPRGLGALILYALGVSILYPRYGVGLGTILALVAATAYLIAYGAFISRIEKKDGGA